MSTNLHARRAIKPRQRHHVPTKKAEPKVIDLRDKEVRVLVLTPTGIKTVYK